MGTYSIVPALVDTHDRQTNYVVSLVNGTLTVIPAVPRVTWTNPAPIIYGAALTPRQLNATVSVPGAFAYNPASGTLLNSGTYSLSFVFTPADATDYSSITDTVSLLVSPAQLTFTASNASRLIGEADPVFTGTFTGLVNGDPITANCYSYDTPTSPAGSTYPIVPSLADPNNRIVNYNVQLFGATLTVLSSSIYSQAYTFTTLAGVAPEGSADGVGTDAQFYFPDGVAVDGAGNAYVVDACNNTVRQITPSGVVTTIAGFAGAFGFEDGTNSDARFNFFAAPDNLGSLPGNLFNNPAPVAIGMDNGGNVYVDDFGNFAIRKIAPSGSNWVVTTVTGQPGYPGNFDGTGSAAFLTSGAVDSAGNLYAANPAACTIIQVTPAGVVTTIAGSGGYGSADGVGSAASFNGPLGVTVDSAGNVYVADTYNDTIRKITNSGTGWVVTTLAGRAQNSGFSDGTGTNALFAFPESLAADSTGNIYVADTGNNMVRMVTSAGLVTTVAGVGATSVGSANGTGSAARFNTPAGAAVDTNGNVYVADILNYTIRKVTPTGVVSTIAGTAGNPGTNDGVGTEARFIEPSSVAVDSAGNVYVADLGNAIRKVTPAGLVTTLAEGSSGAVAMDSADNLYASESYGILIVTSAGVMTTNQAEASFAGVVSLAVDSAGNLYTANSDNDTILEVTPAGVVTTIAGQEGASGSADGTGTNAQFYFPLADFAPFYPGGNLVGLAVDGAGNIYVPDTYNDTIRKVTPVGTNWVVSTIAGATIVAGSTDGAGSVARFYSPQGVAVDRSGNVYVADTGNNTIRKGVFDAFTPASPVPLVQPANNATLVVTLSPTNANGQWRFPWELAWRNSGTAATNLVPNQNYTVEFSPVPGFLAVPAQVPTFVTNGATNFVTGQYYPTITSVDTNVGGSLEVLFQVNPPRGAGWRLLGSTNAFLTSGFTTNLLAGNYLIEFAALSGFTQIPIQSIRISAGVPTVLQEIYQPSQPLPTDSAFLLPVPVSFSEISDLTNYPYGFNGQLVTDVGYGSGVAVGPNVVLTAAHLVFNDQTLSYVSNAYWYPQEEAPQFVPEPQAAQGRLVLSGYASARSNALQSGLYTPGESSPESRNFDVAVLYFSNSVAGGGAGGYLPSDATPNIWLTSTANKMLVGYPVDGSMFQGVSSVTNGQMYETGPQPYPLSLATDPVNDQQVYTASWFLSYPGNSGGPLYVELNGYYYPAGVYLGTLLNGTVPYASAVRAIDSNVVNLITNAQAFVYTGTNSSGGGVVTITASLDIAGNPGYVEVTIAPPAAYRDGGAWKLSTLPDTEYSVSNTSVLEVSSAGAVQVQFKPIPGWDLPTNQAVAVSAGAIVSLTSFYTLNPSNVLISLNASPANSGTVSASGTNAGGTYPLGSTNTVTALANTGFEFIGWSGDATGTNNPLTVIANTSLNITATFSGTGTNITLTVITNGNGAVSPNLNGKMLKAGTKHTLTAMAASGNMFSNWTGSITTNKNPLTVEVDSSMVLQANFIPNPFLPVKGTYNGLFATTNGLTEQTAGMLRGLTVSQNGSYSGTLLIDGVSHAINGRFDLAGLATNHISRMSGQGGLLTVAMTLLSSSNSPPQVTGTVSGTTNGVVWLASLMADLATNIQPSAEYTMLIAPNTNTAPTNSPGGYGYALITNYAGTAKDPASATVKITGALADGAAFNQTVPVSYDGYVPIYAKLYANRGVLLGWINLELTNTRTIPQDLIEWAGTFCVLLPHGRDE